MNKKIVWLAISCLMVVTLLVTSCGGAVTDDDEDINGEEDVINGGEEEEEEEEVVVGEGKDMVMDSLGRLVEKPQYGGTFTFSRTTDVRGFDELTTAAYMSYTKKLTHDELFTGDYSKGPTGSNETSWTTTGSMMWHLEMPVVATSFEHPDPETMVWSIRQGIHFHDKPPVNGRELNAHDVVASIERLFETQGSYLNLTYPEGKRPTSYTALDDWTVEIKCPPGNWGALRNVISDYIAIESKENIEAHDGDLSNWEHDLGSGPFMLTDYVPVSSLTFTRNPDYWRTHPLYPEDTLPYLDEITMVVLQDVSIRMAAFRTGKIETMPGVAWEDWEDFMRTNPWLNYKEMSPAGQAAIYMRVDKPELPYDDIRVRQALMLAIDQDDIVENYYNGHALKYNYPASQLAEMSEAHVPFEQLPEDVQELYGYNPDKARELLTEAGYPDGFECTVLASAEGMLPVIKDMWSKVGVEMNVDIRTSPVVTSVTQRSQQEDMYAGGCDGTGILKFHEYRQDDYMNYSRLNDERCEEIWVQISEYNHDFSKVSEIIYENTPYLLENMWFTLLPSATTYYLWQPWLKAWNGEYTTGYWNHYGPSLYVWIDQEMKADMTGR